MGNRKFSDWQSVLKCRDPLTHVNFKDCNNALKWWSSSNLCHEQPPFSQQYSFWPQDSYYQNSNSNVFLENNSQQLKIPSMPASTVLKFGHPVKGPSVDGGSSKSNENLELQDVHTSKYTAIKHVPFIRRPPDPKLCLGSQWYAINNPVISLPESSSSENKKSVLWSVPSDCSTYLTESEIDSIVSKIAEEANSHNFTPIWMVNESCNEFDQKSVHSSKTIDNTEPDTKDKQQREILAVNSRFKHNRRKQAKPQCSAKKHDPEFQGVIIDIQIQREKNQCKLKLQSSYK